MACIGCSSKAHPMEVSDAKTDADTFLDANGPDARIYMDAPVDGPPALGALSGSYSLVFRSPGIGASTGGTPSSVRAIGTNAFIVEPSASSSTLYRWNGVVRQPLATLDVQGEIFGQDATSLFIKRYSNGSVAVYDTATDTATQIPAGIGVGAVGQGAGVRGGDGNLYVFGFKTLNGTTVNWAGMWTGSAWQQVGGAFANSSNVIATITTAGVLGNYIYVGGAIKTVDGMPANGLVKYNTATSTWSAVTIASAAMGTLATVSELKVIGSKIYILYIDQNAYRFLACLDTSTNTWTNVTLPTGFPGAIATDGTDLYMTNYGSLLRYSGSGWTSLCTAIAEPGNGSSPGVDRGALAVTSDARVLAGVSYGNQLSGAGVLYQEVEYTANVCHSLGQGFVSSTWTTTNGPPEVWAIVPSTSGVYAGGLFYGADGLVAPGVMNFDETSSRWNKVGNGLAGRVRALANTTQGLIAVGDFQGDGAGNPMLRLARYSTGSWTAIGTGLDGAGWAVASSSNGTIYVGGQFVTADTTSANRIASWNGAAFSALGSGLSGSGTVAAYVIAPSTNGVVVGGLFASAGGVAAANVAAWDETSSTWSALGDGLDAPVRTLVTFGGKLCAGGSFTHSGTHAINYVACWNGSSWEGLPQEVNGPVAAMYVGDDGNLYVAGSFTKIGLTSVGGLAAWNGTKWLAPSGAPPSGTNVVFAKAPHVYLGSTGSPGVARYDEQ
jgi:trimeric autotransporter adhesin